MSVEKSATIVYKNGDLLNLTTVRNLLLAYWGMSKAEKRSVRKLIGQYPDEHPLYQKLKDQTDTDDYR